MAILRLKLKNQTLGQYTLQSGVSIALGRREDNDVIISDRSVSGYHAMIESVADRFVLVDLQSSNGSFVNEQLVNSHWLTHGDVINLGEHTLVFELTENDQKMDKASNKFNDTQVMNSSQYRRMMTKSTSHKSINVVRFWDQRQNRSRIKVVRPQDSERPTDSEASRSRAALAFLAGGTGQFKLTRNITAIGKHPNSDIVVKGLLMAQTAATIRLEPDGYYLTYIGGQPKPKINDHIVKSPTRLRHEDIIEIGSTRLQFKID